MTPQDTYRRTLLCGQLPAFHTPGRRRFTARLRWDAGLSIWMRPVARPSRDLAELVQEARDHGPSWRW